MAQVRKALALLQGFARRPVTKRFRILCLHRRQLTALGCRHGAVQGTVELPYLVAQTIIYSLIVYSMIHFEWTAGPCCLSPPKVLRPVAALTVLLQAVPRPNNFVPVPLLSGKFFWFLFFQLLTLCFFTYYGG